MKIRATSAYYDPEKDGAFLEKWAERVQTLNSAFYDRLTVRTSLGNTVVWSYNAEMTDRPAVVFFPGARTCSLFWDIDNVLADIRRKYRVYLVDVNGQPSLSDGNCPAIETDEYGRWAAEVLQQLSLSRVTVVGASFGGLICLKLCIVAPEMVERAVLMNTAGIQEFSLRPKNLFYNLLPILFPARKTIARFLNKAVFYRERHQVPPSYRELMIDYQLQALTRFHDRAQKPRAMRPEELEAVRSKIYLILSDKDILFPYRRTVAIARQHIRSLREVCVVPDTGHGIETSKEAVRKLAAILEK